MENIHNIYILDHPLFINNNINFLAYIKKNQMAIKNMKVSIHIEIIQADQLQDPQIEKYLKDKNIEIFPILITNKKIYKGLHDIINIYETNIRSYFDYMHQKELQIQNEMKRQQFMQTQNEFKIQKEMEKQQMIQKQNEDNDMDDERMHSYISKELQIKEAEHEESPFGDIGNDSMMDTYRHMMTKRSTEKRNPFNNNKLRSLENKKGEDDINMQDIIYKQLQKNKSMEDDDYHEDNIKQNSDDETINIDPTKIEYDMDDDPQDAILEKAYWNRVSETK